jgi:ADP-L-glycero-D-manno-heptose 6-epimerase
MSKVLVTGSEGFIGQNVCQYLHNQGHEVSGWEYVPNTIPDPSHFDWVIHLGAISSTTEKNVDLILDQNFEFSMRLMQACDMMGVNMQYASSASVYGSLTEFNETSPVLPQSPYAWSKYLFDRFVTQHLEDFQVIIQGFRYFNVYGQGEEHKGNQASPVSKFTKQAQETGVIKLFENSDNYVRDFVCVDDICKVHEQMFAADTSGVFNVGTGSTTSFQEIANLVANKYNARIEYVPMPNELISQYQKYTCADITKLSKHVDIQWTLPKEWIK